MSCKSAGEDSRRMKAPGSAKPVSAAAAQEADTPQSSALDAGKTDTSSSSALDASAVEADVCSNCGAPLTGRYCAACGQPADTRIPSLAALLGELVDGLYNLDSRVWRSLLWLVGRPGGLTREYLAGRRARYLPPLRLYLVASLAFFVSDALLDDGDSLPLRIVVDPSALETVAPEPPPGDGVAGALPDELTLQDRLEQAFQSSAADGGRALGAALDARLPLIMFLVSPIMAALFKLAYPRRRYMEHLFFLLHLHAFYYLAMVLTEGIGAMVGALGAEGVMPVLLVAVWGYGVYYAYRALGNVYEQGRAVTVAKMLALSIGYGFVLLLVFLVGTVLVALTL